MRNLFKLLKKISTQYKEANILRTKKALYRVADIEQDKDEDYIVVIQVIGKGTFFKAKPEKILSDDTETDCFSTKDVRTLTYLGYLNTNNPKYKVLTKRHSIELNKMIFALQKKGEKKHTIKTADQISINQEILTNLNQKDAHMIGYITATEQTLSETEEIKKIKKELLEQKKIKEISEKN